MKRRDFMKLCGAAVVSPAIISNLPTRYEGGFKYKTCGFVWEKGGIVSPDNQACLLTNTVDININDGQWHAFHAVMPYNEKPVEIYIDGRKCNEILCSFGVSASEDDYQVTDITHSITLFIKDELWYSFRYIGEGGQK